MRGWAQPDCLQPTKTLSLATQTSKEEGGSPVPASGDQGACILNPEPCKAEGALIKTLWTEFLPRTKADNRDMFNKHFGHLRLVDPENRQTRSERVGAWRFRVSPHKSCPRNPVIASCNLTAGIHCWYAVSCFQYVVTSLNPQVACVVVESTELQMSRTGLTSKERRSPFCCTPGASKPSSSVEYICIHIYPKSYSGCHSGLQYSPN